MKRRKRRRGRVLVVLILLLILAGGIGTYAYLNFRHPQEKPQELFTKYIDALKQGKYEEMYSYLSTDSKKTITKDGFVQRNKKIYNGIEMQNLEVTLSQNNEEEIETKVSYHMSFDTCAGKVEFDGCARYIEEKEGYMLAWDDSLILPELKSQDKVKVTSDEAKRGRILDRNGLELATEAYASSVGLIPGKMSTDSKNQVAKLLNISEDVIEKKLGASWVKDDSFVPLKTLPKVDETNLMMNNADASNVKNSKLQDKLLKVPGVLITDVTMRSYPYGEATSHLIGYVQNVTAEDLKKHKGEGYTASSQIGRSGIEAAYEKELKGKNGIEIIIVDASGRKKKVVAIQPKKDGEDIKLTIDAAFQQKVYEMYKKDKSVSVAMDPFSGEVLALVSTPSFDSNDFILGMSEEKWKSLNDNKAKPMYNRFRQSMCPGSSFKPVMASIALQNKAIDPDKDYKSEGTSWQKDKSWGSYYITTLHTYTPVNMKNALIYSDNIYFAKAALALGAKKYQKSLDAIGFGKKMPFELSLSKSQYGNDGKIKGEVQLADSGYGQGEVLVNPVHMASIYSAFVNQGTMIKPYLRYEENKEAEAYIKDAFSKKTTALVKEGLEAVVNDPHGTGYDAHRSDITLAGKTGTAEIKQSKEDKNGTELGWFNVMTTDKTAEKRILLITMVEDVKGRGGSGYVVKKSAKLLDEYLKE